MASQSLYRKWRSQTFSDLVGQEPIIQTLKNALHDGKLAHAYLFTGPRGTGKTSTARLLAKTINCPDSKDGEPCNICEQCRQITIGNSFNVIEIDAASNRGIDSIRDLREKVMMPPTTGKYKVYILDEAHMLTTEAFNALLKTLEEPPPHAIFVMATTDVHKMLPTVLSRCQRFDFKRITTRQIVEHLHFIAEQEKVVLERGAAELIARAASGGMRDALSLLDQAIAYAGEHVTLPQVQTMLGVADPRAIQKFILHVAQLDSAGGLHLVNELVEAGADLRQVNNQIAEFWRAMMLTKAGADIAAIIDGTVDEVNEIKQASQLFVLEELTECARIFAQNELVQKSQGTPQLGLELALLNSISLHRRTQSGQIASLSAATPSPAPTTTPMRRTETLSSAPIVPPIQPVQPVAPPIQHVVPPIQPVTPVVPPIQPMPSPSTPLEEIVQKQDEDLPDWETMSYLDEEEDVSPAPLAIQAPLNVPVAAVDPIDAPPAQEESTRVTLTLEEVKERWEYIKRRVKTRKGGARIAALLNGCSIVRVEETDSMPLIFVMASAGFHYTALQKQEDQDAVEWALKIELGRECRLRLLPPGSAGGTILPPVMPPPTSPTVNNRAASAAPPSSPLRSAHLERPPVAPIREVSRTTPPRPENQRVVTAQKPVEPTSGVVVAPTSVREQPAALARNPVVRENSSSTIDAGVGNIPSHLPTQKNVTTGLENVSEKAHQDPVVQEVVRMFKARIKDVHLK